MFAIIFSLRVPITEVENSESMQYAKHGREDRRHESSYIATHERERKRERTSKQLNTRFSGEGKRKGRKNGYMRNQKGDGQHLDGLRMFVKRKKKEEGGGAAVEGGREHCPSMT